MTNTPCYHFVRYELFKEGDRFVSAPICPLVDMPCESKGQAVGTMHFWKGQAFGDMYICDKVLIKDRERSGLPKDITEGLS